MSPADEARVRLDGKAVIVTGAGRGLGRAYALELAALGAHVVVNDVDAPAAEAVVAEIADLGGDAISHVGSAGDRAAAAALVETCLARFGAVDGLVNNAALIETAAAWDVPEESAARLVEVNVLGALFCGIHALRAMRAKGSGAIVNITSGAHLGVREMSVYGATKGAIVSLTYAWALDGAAVGIRANAVSPVALTRMHDGRSATMGGHIPPPEAVAPLVAFLLSDAASDITGQVIRLDGRGLSTLRPGSFCEPAPPQEPGWTPASVELAIRAQLDSGSLGIGLKERTAATRVPPER